MPLHFATEPVNGAQLVQADWRAFRIALNLFRRDSPWWTWGAGN
jgi:hypothetical protein